MPPQRKAVDSIYLKSRVKVCAQTGCWLWLRGKHTFGYGLIGAYKDGGARTSEGAHRASYRIFKGEIPAGMNVCHRCDTPACINPEHLFLGTAMDNVRDCIAKGRKASVPGREPALDDATRRVIRRRYANRPRRNGNTERGHGIAVLAKEYGVDYRTMWNAINGGRKAATKHREDIRCQI